MTQRSMLTLSYDLASSSISPLITYRFAALSNQLLEGDLKAVIESDEYQGVMTQNPPWNNQDANPFL